MRIITLFLVLFLASPLLAGEKKPDDGPKKPAELKVLDRLIGTWKDEVIFKVSEWTKKERRETATYSNSWSLNGWFVQNRGRNGDGKAEDLQLMTFDVEKKVFRRWYFDSDGDASESKGQWDAKTATLTWTCDLGDGITAVSVWRFSDMDTIIWSRIAKDGKGKIYSNIEGKSVRQK
jgi:Protein of unknown function (DUF1579)